MLEPLIFIYLIHITFLFCVEILYNYVCRIHTGGDLFRVDSQAGDAVLKQLWHHSDAIMCCSLKTNVRTLFITGLQLDD